MRCHVAHDSIDTLPLTLYIYPLNTDLFDINLTNNQCVKTANDSAQMVSRKNHTSSNRTISSYVPFLILFITFTNKEFGIDIRRGQQDYNPPQSRRPCRTTSTAPATTPTSARPATAHPTRQLTIYFPFFRFVCVWIRRRPTPSIEWTREFLVCCTGDSR